MVEDRDHADTELQAACILLGGALEVRMEVADAHAVVFGLERQAVTELLKQEENIDLVIPRGGESLIRFVVENAHMPVLKHYKGVCHIFVDASADLAMAETICMNYAARNLWRKHTEDFKTVLGVAGAVPRHYAPDDVPSQDPRAPANIACGKRLCGQARPDWGMAVVLVPWFNWLYCGDRENAEDAWPMMTDYMDFLLELEVEDYL